MAFGAVMFLWNKKPLKVHGARMSESLLNILCHIINSEALIRVSMLYIRTKIHLRVFLMITSRKSL